MDKAVKYADQVLSGKILANEKIKLACQRFKNELAKQKTKEFPYHYDSELAERVYKFIELLPTTDGKPLKLELFQCFILGNLYGWRLDSDDSRRFTRALLSFARKNGKTFIIACMGVVELLMEKEPARNRQILFTANGAKQAHLAFDMMTDQLNAIRGKSKYMRQRVKINKQRVTDLESNSFAVPLATENKPSIDGYDPSLAVMDEMHESKTTNILNSLKSGQVLNPNSLLAIISTAGYNLNSPFKAECDYAADILNNKQKADRYFVVMYGLDDKDEVYNPDMWIKANPLMSNERIRKTMLEKIKSDLDIAVSQGKVNDILVKNMNMFTQSREDSYISADDWGKAKSAVASSDLKNRDVYIGVDLSKTNDLTAVSWLVPIGNGRFYCDSHSFVGTKYGLENKIKRDGIDYVSMEKTGECSITRLDSGIIDYDSLVEFVQKLIGKYNWTVKAIAYDPYNAQTVITKFEKLNYPLFEVRQGLKTLNIPTRNFRDLLFDGKIKHSGNKILAYAVNNAIIKVVNNGWQLDKAKNSNRIDPIAALINAYVAAMNYYDNEEESKAKNEYYETATSLF
ncbi:MAG: terminase TerL endonuclease subunit [Liquorilactobacillus nagelii]|uniref:terminase large subunit n=1 Tax=Liquorilactobacillus nagelii TaxID=82688 RepID=UPI0039E87C26